MNWQNIEKIKTRLRLRKNVQFFISQENIVQKICSCGLENFGAVLIDWVNLPFY